MADFNLHAPEGATKKRRRVGRGQSSGLGTTAGRGNKGQQSRSGGKTYPGFEGGQMPLYRRLPHRGFTNTSFKKALADRQPRAGRGQVRGRRDRGRRVPPPEAPGQEVRGAHQDPRRRQLTKALTFQVDKVSASAKAKIEKAGGTVETPSGDDASTAGDARRGA